MDKTYAKSFKTAKEGHAVYANVSGDKMKPGACGYFDYQGDWVTIVQTSDPEALKNAGLGPPTGIEYETDPGSRSFGPRWSHKVVGATGKVDAKISIPGAPVGGGFMTSFTCQTDFGVVLVSDGDVTHRKAFPPKPYRAWMEENLEKIVKFPLADEQIIRKKGIWIITKTHTAKKRAFAVLESRGSQVAFGIDVEVANIATISPSAGWWKSTESSSGWTKDINEENGVVLFASGICWKPRRFLSKRFKIIENRKKQEFLGPEDKGDVIPIDLKLTNPQPGEEYLRFRPYQFGKADGLEDLYIYDSDEPEEMSEDEDEDDDGEMEEEENKEKEEEKEEEHANEDKNDPNEDARL